MVVFLVDHVRRFCARLVGRRTPGSCVVLEYHAVPVEERERFAEQMDLLRRIATPLPADSRDVLAPSRRHVALTFDDGLTSFLQNAVPELQQRGIPAAVFVVTERLGTVPSWTSYAAAGAPDETMLDAGQLRALPELVIVGSHTATHAKLTELGEAEARREISASRRELESILGRNVTLFSYPYGAFSDQLNEFCREAGYERIFTNLPELALSDPHEFLTGRVEVKPTDSPLEFRLKVAGSYRWLPYAFALKRAMLDLFSRQSKRVEPRRPETHLRLP